MISKVVAVVALLAVAYCQDHSHSYTLKTVVKHEEPKKVETYKSIPLAYKSDSHSGHAISSQSIIHHGHGYSDSQENGYNTQYAIPTHYQYAPVHKTVTVQSAPVYESHSSGQTHGHAVSSQSIIRHDSGHKESQGEAQQSQGNTYNTHYTIPTQYQYAPIHQTVAIQSAPVYESHSAGQSHGHAVSSQSIVRHDSGHKESQGQAQAHYVIPVHHQPAPIHETVSIHAAPVLQVQSGEQKYGHAISSQNIVRHDSHESQGNSGHYTPIEYQHVAPVQHTLNIHAAPIQHLNVQQSGHEESYEKEYYTHPKYEFEYKVEDPHTKDIKFQHEARDGDVVKGIYSLHEADGSIRTVKYSADKHSGFNAHVENSGESKHIEQQQQYHH